MAAPVRGHQPEDESGSAGQPDPFTAILARIDEQLAAGPVDDRYVKCDRCGCDWHGLHCEACFRCPGEFDNKPVDSDPLVRLQNMLTHMSNQMALICGLPEVFNSDEPFGF